jgi:WD40 repeat protein
VLAGRNDDATTLFAGSWSAQIYAWNASTRELLYVLKGGQTDFVKTLLLFSLPIPSSSANPPNSTPPQSRPLLASAGADTRIVLWDVSPTSLTDTPRQLATLSGHGRPVLALASDPFAGEAAEATLFSGSSDAEIRRWKVESGGPDSKTDTVSVAASASEFPEPLRPQHTSITSLGFSSSGDLWTSSADGSVKCLARPGDSSGAAAADTAWKVDTELDHGATNPVRCMALSSDGRFVVTGCRDEDVWVWDAGTGDVLGRFAGHADEVTDVLLLGGHGSALGAVVSAALDGTVRRWEMEDLVKVKGEGGEDGQHAPLVEDEKTEESPNRTPPTAEGGDIKLTEEEEAELAALMEED